MRFIVALVTAAFCWRLDKAAFMADVGNITQIGVKEASGTVTWSTSNASVALVSSTGQVTAIGKGDAIITATLGAERQTCHVSVGYEGQNPFLPPTWGLFIADGEPHVFDGILYVYGSRDYPYSTSPSGGKSWCSEDYHVIYSQDLIHWVDAGVSFTTADIPERIRPSKLWAPDCFYDKVNKKYYLLSCGTNADGRYYIAESQFPVGPFGNVKEITLNGEKIGNIDPGGLVDDDGTVYMAMPGTRSRYPVGGNSSFRYGILERDTGFSTLKPSSIINIHDFLESTDANYYPFEGPSLRKVGSVYYYIFISSRNGEAVPTRMDYVYSRDMKSANSWKNGGVIIETRDFLSVGNVHGSFTEFKGQYYLFFHRAVPGISDMTRMPQVDKLTINAEGLLQPVIRTSSGVKGSFRIGEQIQAASVALLSGGRSDTRLIHRGVQNAFNKNIYTFEGYAYSYFEQTGQWLGFRYVNFGDGRAAQMVHVSVRATAKGGTLAFKTSPEAPAFASIPIPSTDNAWQVVSARLANAPTGVKEVYVELVAAPSAGRVEFDWFKFTS